LLRYCVELPEERGREVEEVLGVFLLQSALMGTIVAVLPYAGREVSQFAGQKLMI
jgi:hypothetical protein